MLRLPRRWIFGCLCLTAITAFAEKTCGLDARNRWNMPLPVIGSDDMSPRMAAELDHGFRLIYIFYEPQKANAVLEPVLAEARQSHNLCGEALAQFGLGQIARSLQVSAALPHFRRAEELLQQVGTPLALAHVHNRLAMTEALTGDREGFARDEPPVAGEFESNGDLPSAVLQHSMINKRKEGESVTAYQQRLFSELDASSTPNTTMARGFVHFQWSIALENQGSVREAMEHAQQAVKYFKQCDCGPVTMAGIYMQMALLTTRDDDPSMTLVYAQEADRIYTQIHLESQRAMSLRSIALAYDSLEDYDRAIPAYLRALDMALAQGIPDNVMAVAVSLSQVYGRNGDPHKGIDLITSVRPAQPDENQRCRYDAALAVLTPRAEMWAEGEVRNRKWLAECAPNFPPIDTAIAEGLLANSLVGLGRGEEALPHAQHSIEILEELRHNIALTDRSLTAFQQHQRGLYDIYIQALISLNRPEEALVVSEKFRGRPFLDLVSSGDATPAAAAELVAAQVPLAQRVSHITQTRASIPGANEPTLRSTPRPFSLTAADLRHTVEQTHSTLISYWVGVIQTTIWVMAPGKPVISRQSNISQPQMAALVRATLPAEPDAVRRRGNILHTRGGMRQSLASSDSKPWRALYDALIAPVADELPTEPGSLLTIVPEESLHRLAFAALRAPDGKYLIEQYALHTIPAAGMLQVTQRNELRVAKNPNYVLVANPQIFPMVNGQSLPALPGTGIEARGIQRALRASPVQLLEGRSAGVDSLLQALPQATVLHLATHAVVSDSAPMTSFLALDSRQRGGTLTAAEVYGLHIHSSLVVLSACSTGRGQVSGDGVAGLGRAFFYAGAASLVTTLWDVVDEPTARLMPKFYAALAEGKSRSAALREAQLSLIDDLRKGRVRVETLSGATRSLPERPSYWAAFSLSGQP